MDTLKKRYLCVYVCATRIFVVCACKANYYHGTGGSPKRQHAPLMWTQESSVSSQRDTRLEPPADRPRKVDRSGAALIQRPEIHTEKEKALAARRLAISAKETNHLCLLDSPIPILLSPPPRTPPPPPHSQDDAAPAEFAGRTTGRGRILLVRGIKRHSRPEAS
jgi:hypothetical protein